jgi:hypothetical protein
MLFIAYILFLTYWALEGYSTAVCDFHIKNKDYLKKIKYVSFSMRTLFIIFTFGLVYFYTENLYYSIGLTITFLLGVPHFYKGFKYRTLSKFDPNTYRMGWFDSDRKTKQNKMFDAKMRVFLLAASGLLVVLLEALR